MSKSKKNQNQLSMNLDQEPKQKGCMKQQVYRVLVQLHDREGTDGHTAEVVAKVAKSVGFKASRVQVRNTLRNLAFDNHAIVKVIAGRRRFFLGPIPYSEHIQKNVTGCVLLALKTINSNGHRGRHTGGYTNIEIHQYMKDTGYDLTRGQVSCATSRCQIKGLIGVKSFRNEKGHREDRFRWTLNPEAEAIISNNTKPETTPTLKPAPSPATRKLISNAIGIIERDTGEPGVLPTPRVRRVSQPIVRQLRKVNDEAKHLIGKALIGREIPPNARVEAFALIDAFDALLGKL